ncbi:MAG: GtrA family protein [Clostridiales bacterium]|nr:GtrA family protein [Clostridiales bacterium]
MEINQKVQLTPKENFIQFIKFSLFSASAGIIEISSFTLLNELTTFKYWPSYLIALTLSVLYNFTVNRRFTFKSASNIPIAMLKVFGFYCIFTPLSTWWGNQFAIMGVNEYLIIGGTMIVNFISEFIFVRFIVFKNSINTNDLVKEKS